MRLPLIISVVSVLSLAAAGVGVAVRLAGRPPPALSPAAAADAGSAMEAAPSIAVLERRIQAILDRSRIAGAGIVVANRDGVLWAGGVGVADRATHRPVTADTPFRLGSVSKSITALAVMELVESGRLSLDGRLRELAPEVSFENPWEASNPVLVGQLLEHTAGFEMARFNEQFDDRLPPRSLLDALAVNPRSRRSRWPPGTRMSYSNEGYLTAGYLLEKITGRPFDTVVRDGVFTPLGMRTAAFRLAPEIAGSRARGYRDDGSEYPYLEDMMRPAANLLASPNDMGRYLLMWLRRGELDGHRLLSRNAVERIEERRTLPYGGPEERYGLADDVTQYAGHVAHGHSGYTDGFRASFRYFPREGVGWTLMLNSSGGEGATSDIERELLGFLMRGGSVPPQRVSRAVAGGSLADLAGFYVDVTPSEEFWAPLQRLFRGREFQAREGALWERPSGGGGLLGLVRRPPWQRLTALGDGTFRRDGESISSLYFTRADGGARVLVTRDGYLEMSSGSVRVAEWAALQAALLVLFSAVVLTPLWLVPALVAGRPTGDLWARGLPVTAAVAALAAYGLLSRSPQPLGQVNPTTVGICALTSAFAAASVLALGAALRAAAGDSAWLVTAHSVLAATACVGLTLFAGSAHWIGVRTWSW